MEELLGEGGVCVDPGIGLDEVEVVKTPKDNSVEVNELRVS
jgi:hypothetical protein